MNNEKINFRQNNMSKYNQNMICINNLKEILMVLRNTLNYKNEIEKKTNTKTQS